MKSIPQNILILIGCIVIAIVILGVFGFYSTKIPLQRQAIHVFDAPNLKITDPSGRINISEIKPNSMLLFYYPDPDRFKDRDPFERFILIRLPDNLGGTVNDASAFRAYSGIDPTSHCIIKYWPQEERRKIEDSCSGNMYDPVSGHVTTNFGHSVLVSKNVALPYLDLSSDENGFLYVEPPVWTEDKNGVVGIGRLVSEKETESVRQMVAAREKQFKDAMRTFKVPSSFSTGHKMLTSNKDRILTGMAEYASDEPNSSSIFLYYKYCNCTGLQGLNEEANRPNTQFPKVYETQVIAYPNSINYGDGVDGRYVFIFYDDGFKLTLYTDQKLEPGLMLVRELLDFDND